jgi:hypothetical protein
MRQRIPATDTASAITRPRTTVPSVPAAAHPVAGNAAKFSIPTTGTLDELVAHADNTGVEGGSKNCHRQTSAAAGVAETVAGHLPHRHCSTVKIAGVDKNAPESTRDDSFRLSEFRGANNNVPREQLSPVAVDKLQLMDPCEPLLNGDGVVMRLDI